ncbi:MAG: type II secretion system protein GspM [Nevskiaceae bacterium]
MNPNLQRLRDRWSALEERERRMLAGGAVFLGLVVLYLGIWEPLANASRQQQVDLVAARALAVQLETLAASASDGSTPSAGAGQSLLAIVDQTRQASAITKPPTRLQPEGEGDTVVRIWLDDVPYDALVRWLAELQSRYGVRVADADMERESGPGLVNARLTLTRG